MEFNLFYSNTYRGAFDQLCQELKNNRSKTDILSGKTHFVVVPDRFSLTIEKAVLDKLGILGAIDIEVVSFSRLANIVLGDKIHKCLSPESSVMLLARVIRENREKLQCYDKIKDITAFAKDMYASISEIRNNDISPNMLDSVLPNIKNHGIKIKTADIVLLYRLYLKELHNTYNDATTKLERLIEEIPNSNKIVNSYIYITDFYYFKGVEYNIIKALMLNTLGVNIALIECPDNKCLNRRIYPYYQIQELADELGIAKKIKKKTYPLNNINQAIERRLFSYDTLDSIECGSAVQLYYANDKISELKAVAREIQKEIREGKRFRDIAIVCGDIKSYTPLIESVFNKFDIPYFIDLKESISNHPLIRFLFSLLDYEQDQSIVTALEVIKNIFFDADYEKIMLFDNYCFEYKIKGYELLSPFKKGDADKITIPERIREKFIGVLNALNLKPKDTVENYIDKIRNLFDKLNCDIKMSNLIDIQNKNGDERYAEITNQLPQKISDILNEMSEMLGNQELSLDEFSTMFKANLGSVSISMIPQYIDCVIIGEPLESRFAIIKSLYMIGASDNNIPYTRIDTGIITTREINEWKLSFYPNKAQASLLDKLYLHQLLIKAEEKLYISYTTKADDGEFLNPSIIITQLERIFKTNLKSIESIRINDLDDDNKRVDYYAYRFTTKENALEELIHYLRRSKKGLISNSEIKSYDALYSLMDDDVKLQILDINNMYKNNEPYIKKAKELFFKKDEYTSVSQLQTYFECPFKHYANYGLRIDKRDEITIDVLKIGSIVHYSLERFVIRVLNKYPKFNGYEKDKDMFIKKATDDIELNKEFAQILKDIRYRKLIIDLIIRSINILCDAVDKSNFKPFLVETNMIKTPLTITKGEISIKLKGKIDRIDKYKNSVVVVDYKTGNIDSNLITGLYYGNKIQLFMYLKAYIDNGYDLGGLLYMDMKNKYTNENENVYPYNGYISEEYIDNFELIADTLIGNRKKKVLTSESLENLLNYAVKVSCGAIGEIAEGYIEAKPTKKICKNCEYKDFCMARLIEPNYRKKSSKCINNID